MLPLRANPHLLELNTRVWLNALSRRLGRTLTLDTVPDEEWEAFKGQGFDALWLMGVWKPSPLSARIALEEPGLRKIYDEVLPGWKPEDVGGSPYAVHGYELNPALGARGDLFKLKRKLNDHGLRLILDFVCNHLAADHPWTRRFPERFVGGTAEDVAKEPVTFFEVRTGDKQQVLAHGKDPNFPAWSDTVQLNYFRPETREEMFRILEHTSYLCDGVRCDMAMLLLNEVHEQVWGPRLLGEGVSRPTEEFWPRTIARIKEHRPDFLFIAEVYWGLEWKLQEMGFDYTYDKTLYDRLQYMGPLEVRGHLWAEEAYQRRSLRFIENHDEARSAVALGREKGLAAATAMATLKGMRFFHDGQAQGFRAKVPVHLVRGPDEPVDSEVRGHYEKLFQATRHPAFHGGEWSLLDALPAAQGDRTANSLLTWCWRQGRHVKLVVINYSNAPARGRVKLPSSGSETVVITDEMSSRSYERLLAELQDPGLFVELEPWKSHLFSIPL
jgi:hypothetical protein